MAAGHINVLSHYLDPADVATVVAAAVAVGAAIDRGRRRLRERAERVPAAARAGPRVAAARRALLGPTAAIVAAGLVAIALSRPFAPLSAAARRSVGLEATIATRLSLARPVIAAAIPDGGWPRLPEVGPMGAADPRQIRLDVPAHRVVRLSIDLGVPLTRIAATTTATVDLANGRPAPGTIVYLDRVASRMDGDPSTAALRVAAPTTIGGIRVVPLLVDADGGLWVVRIEPDG